MREAKEEVGFDVSEQLNRDNLLTSNWQGHESFIFIVPGIPDATKFETTTRKEISEIKWHDIFTLPSSEEDFSGIHSLPNSKRSRYFSVLPFVKPLQRWVLSRRKTLGEIPKMLDVEHPRTTVYSSNATSKRGNRREAPSKQRVEAKSMKRNTKDVETFGMGKPFSSREEERQFFQACLDRNSNNTDIQPKVHSFPQDKGDEKGNGFNNFVFCRQDIEEQWDQIALGST